MAASRTTASRTAIAIAAFVAILGFATVVALSAGDADAKSAKVIGKTKKTPKPSCPTPTNKNGQPVTNAPAYKYCQGIGEVTALQKRANGERNPYKVPQDGTLVAWGIELGKPSKADQDFFTNMPPGGPTLGPGGGVGWGSPSARISVLKKKKHKKFKLVKQSSKVELKSHLGSSPIFTLDKPLKVRAGLFVALTTGSWYSAFAHDEPVTSQKGDVWLSSREKKHCGDIPPGAGPKKANKITLDMVKHSRPQQKVGSTRAYKCTYGAGRILYQAYFVPKGGKKGT